MGLGFHPFIWAVLTLIYNDLFYLCFYIEHFLPRINKDVIIIL